METQGQGDPACMGGRRRTFISVALRLERQRDLLHARLQKLKSRLVVVEKERDCDMAIIPRWVMRMRMGNRLAIEKNHLGNAKRRKQKRPEGKRNT